jgi:Mn-dependent DtxR family transcriptional regulator
MLKKLLTLIKDLNDAERGATSSAISRRIPCSPSRASSVLAPLISDGLVESDERGGLWLTEAGHAAYEREQPRPVDPEVLACAS